jgi:hypothetical protein
MPPYDRLGANDRYASRDAWKQPVNPHKEQSIQTTQSKTLGRLPAKNPQLMAKDQVFSLEPSP